MALLDDDILFPEAVVISWSVAMALFEDVVPPSKTCDKVLVIGDVAPKFTFDVIIPPVILFTSGEWLLFATTAWIVVIVFAMMSIDEVAFSIAAVCSAVVVDAFIIVPLLEYAIPPLVTNDVILVTYDVTSRVTIDVISLPEVFLKPSPRDDVVFGL